MSSEITTSIPFPKDPWLGSDPISQPALPSPEYHIPGFFRVETKSNLISQEFEKKNGKPEIKKWLEYRSEVFFDTYENAYKFWERVKKCDALKQTISISPHPKVPRCKSFEFGRLPICSIHPFDLTITRPFDYVWERLNGKEESPVQTKSSSEVFLEKMKQQFPPIPGSHEEMKARQRSDEKEDTSGVDTESSVDADEPHFAFWGELDDI